MSKKSKLLQLARKRQEARWVGYKRIGDYCCGAYECDYVSPYTKSANNVHSKIFVLLQDWSSDSDLSGRFDVDAATIGYTRASPTNKNLQSLLWHRLEVTLAQVYVTNLFPFIKMGAMNSTIPTKDLLRAAKEFAIPQIEIVKPQLVICLGLETFNSLRSACGERRVNRVANAVSSKSIFSIGITEVWGQSHPGALGRANRNKGGVDRVTGDWSAMAKILQ